MIPTGKRYVPRPQRVKGTVRMPSLLWEQYSVDSAMKIPEKRLFFSSYRSLIELARTSVTRTSTANSDLAVVRLAECIFHARSVHVHNLIEFFITKFP